MFTNKQGAAILGKEKLKMSAFMGIFFIPFVGFIVLF
jgi:hypothetical protein